MYKLSSRVLIGLAAVGLMVLSWGCSKPADSTSVAAGASSVEGGGSAAAGEKTGLKLAIPDSGRVTLVNKEELRGRISVDQGRRVVVKAGSDSEKAIPFDTLGRVSYEPEAKVYRANGELVIRGSGSKATPVSTNIEVGWDDFSNINKELGQVRVMLPTQKYESVIAVAKDSQYVVEEIVFDPQQKKMNIRVRAY